MVKVETVASSQQNRLCPERSGGRCRRVPALELHVNETTEMLAQAILRTDSGREDVPGTPENEGLAVRRGITAVLIVDLAAPQKEIAVHAQAGKNTAFNPDTAKCAFLRVDVAPIDRVRSAALQKGSEAVIRPGPDVDTRSYAEVLAAA